MGYRKLLKDYMQHVEGILGTDLVELAAFTNALDKRSIVQLRSLAAELKRESYTEGGDDNYNPLIHKLLSEGRIELHQLGLVNGIEPNEESEPLTEASIARLINVMEEYH